MTPVKSDKNYFTSFSTGFIRNGLSVKICDYIRENQRETVLIFIHLIVVMQRFVSKKLRFLLRKSERNGFIFLLLLY